MDLWTTMSIQFGPHWITISLCILSKHYMLDWHKDLWSRSWFPDDTDIILAILLMRSKIYSRIKNENNGKPFITHACCLCTHLCCTWILRKKVYFSCCCATTYEYNIFYLPDATYEILDENPCATHSQMCDVLHKQLIGLISWQVTYILLCCCTTSLSPADQLLCSPHREESVSLTDTVLTEHLSL